MHDVLTEPLTGLISKKVMACIDSDSPGVVQVTDAEIATSAHGPSHRLFLPTCRGVRFKGESHSFGSRRFLPRETTFFDFFEQHAALTIEGTKEFLSMVTTGANIAAKCRRISDIEHETDTITHRCVEALHKTTNTPIDRDSIHRLITRMDDVMDYVEAAAERIDLYEITSMTNDVRDMADVLLRSAQHVELAIRGVSVEIGQIIDESLPVEVERCVAQHSVSGMRLEGNEQIAELGVRFRANRLESGRAIHVRYCGQRVRVGPVGVQHERAFVSAAEPPRCISF